METTIDVINLGTGVSNPSKFILLVWILVMAAVIIAVIRRKRRLLSVKRTVVLGLFYSLICGGVYLLFGEISQDGNAIRESRDQIHAQVSFDNKVFSLEAKADEGTEIRPCLEDDQPETQDYTWITMDGELIEGTLTKSAEKNGTCTYTLSPTR